MRKKEENSSSEKRNSVKKASLLKTGIKRIGSFCSRSRNNKGLGGGGGGGGGGNTGVSSMPSLMKKEETGTCLFDDDDDDDDSCLWLSSSTSTSSFFDEQSSLDEEWMKISSWVVSAMPRILDDDGDDEDKEVGSWVMEFEKDMSFLVDLDLDQWDYCCIPSSFPSPSFNTTSTSTTTCTGNSTSTKREAELTFASQIPSDVLEHLKVEDGDASPLLWPFEGWNHPEETLSFFVMSPRKDYIAKSEHQELQQRTRVVSGRSKKSIHRSDLGPESMEELKRDMKTTKFTGPSRLIKSLSSKNSKALMRVVPLEMMKIDHCDDVSIEMLVGLEEFDGNEGMNSSSKHHINVANGGVVGDHIFSLVDLID